MNSREDLPPSSPYNAVSGLRDKAASGAGEAGAAESPAPVVAAKAARAYQSAASPAESGQETSSDFQRTRACAEAGDADCAQQLAAYYAAGKEAPADAYAAYQWAHRARLLRAQALRRERRLIARLFPANSPRGLRQRAASIAAVLDSQDNLGQEIASLKSWSRSKGLRWQPLPERAVLTRAPDGSFNLTLNTFVIDGRPGADAQVQEKLPLEDFYSKRYVHHNLVQTLAVNRSDAYRFRTLPTSHYSSLDADVYDALKRERIYRRIQVLAGPPKAGECSRPRQTLPYVWMSRRCSYALRPLAGLKLGSLTRVVYRLSKDAEERFDSLGHRTKGPRLVVERLGAERLLGRRASKVNWNNLGHVDMGVVQGMLETFDGRGNKK